MYIRSCNGTFRVRLFKEDDLEKRIQLRVGALPLILIIFPKLDVIVEKYKNTNRSDSVFRFQIADMTFVNAGKNKLYRFNLLRLPFFKNYFTHIIIMLIFFKMFYIFFV